MKIKKIIDICKKTGNIIIYNTERGSWLSDGFAWYPTSDLPQFDEVTLCEVYDITDSQASKINFRHEGALPSEFCFDDLCEEEELSSRGPLWLSSGNTGIIPYEATQGVEFIKAKYFAPLSDIKDSMLDVYERISASGKTYFVAKTGLIVVAVITACDVVNKEFVAQLMALTKQCEVKLFNDTSTTEPAQMNMEDGGAE